MVAISLLRSPQSRISQNLALYLVKASARRASSTVRAAAHLCLHRRRRGDSGHRGNDPAVQRVQPNAARVAPTGIAVLLNRETGTGKAHLARAIHISQPGNRPVVTLPSIAVPSLRSGYSVLPTGANGALDCFTSA